MPIPLDALSITFLARDLDGLLGGREIERVAIAEDKTLAISFRGAAGRLAFLYDPGFPILCFAEHALSRAAELAAPRFEDALRGGIVERASQGPGAIERIVRVDVAREDDRGVRTALHLIFELAPPFPNLFLTDATGRIMAVLLRAGTRTKRRTLAQGEPYLPPAAQGKSEPLAIDPASLETLAWQKDDEALSKAVMGVSPLASRAIISRARRLGSLGAAYAEMIDAYRAGRAAPCIFRAAPGLSAHAPRIGLSWWRPALEGVLDLKPMASVNDAAAAAARTFLRTSAAERRRAALERVIARETARWQAVERDAEKARKGKDRAAELRRWGELVTAHLGRIKKGVTEVSLPDIYSETGGVVTVRLEPHLTPHANADAYFKKARRAERAARLADDTLRQARRKLSELAALAAEIAGAAEGEEGAEDTIKISPARLKEIESLVGRPPAERKDIEAEADARATSLGIRPRRFVVADGWVVLVGRSAQENDILTHKYAAPSDLWFHARLAQGSHVVLKRDRKKTEPSRQAIVDAARLAAYFSKAKSSKHVPVSYTEKRYVKKVRKGAPGLAALLREKVVFVNPAPPKDETE
jgi:predicted ribosome quality control (RQC) complex YloA/Tae2 family protein